MNANQRATGEPETAETAARQPEGARPALLLDRVGRLTVVRCPLCGCEEFKTGGDSPCVRCGWVPSGIQLSKGGQ